MARQQLVISLGLILGVGLSYAQQPSREAAPNVPPAATPEPPVAPPPDFAQPAPQPNSGPTPGRRDPTLANDELRRLLSPQASPSEGLAPARASEPLIRVSGLILGSRGHSSAVLVLGERYFTVHPGKIFHLDGGRSLTVTAIDRAGVTIELSPDGQKLTLP
jgi:hypothetical protein